MAHQHFIIHKPFGYLSQFKYELKRKKKLLGTLYPFPEGTMAIGRLDEDSEGLLFLTTDGRVSEVIRSQEVPKTYQVQLDGVVTEAAILALQKGVSIGLDGGKYITKPCVVKIIASPTCLPARSKAIRDDRHGPTSWAEITITEGKNRQVRKMFAAVGFPVLRLIRVAIGNVRLEDIIHKGKVQVDWFEVH